MANTKATITINRGTTKHMTVNYRKDGVLTSLVGALVFFTIKSKEYDDDPSDSSALLKKTVAGGADSANGSVQIVINPADTQNITPNSYFFDVKVREAGGDIYKLVEGKVILDGSPTNRQT